MTWIRFLGLFHGRYCSVVDVKGRFAGTYSRTRTLPCNRLSEHLDDPAIFCTSQAEKGFMLDVLVLAQFAGPFAVGQLAGGVLVGVPFRVDSNLIIVRVKGIAVTDLVAQQLEDFDQTLNEIIPRSLVGPVIPRRRLPPGIRFPCCPRDAVVGLVIWTGNPVVFWPEIREPARRLRLP